MRSLIAASTLAVAAVSAPAYSATFVDTGVTTTAAGGPVSARPVNPTTTLLAQFSLAQASTIQSIETYGRTVTSGQGFYAIYSSVADRPGALLYSATGNFLASSTFGYMGLSGLAFNLAAGNYFVGFGQASSSFTAYVFGSAPNPLGIEGAFKPAGYVPTNNVDLSYRISGLSGAGAVPEPATWALMIGGFGFVGGAMRYRRGKRTVRFA